MNNLVFLTAPAQAANGWGSLIIWVGMLAVMYMFLILPQKKRQKKVAEMQSSIKAGDNVVTTSGFYGVVIDVLKDVVIVEFGNNRNNRIPVQREAIAGIAAPVLVEKEEVKEEKK